MKSLKLSEETLTQLKNLNKIKGGEGGEGPIDLYCSPIPLDRPCSLKPFGVPCDIYLEKC